MNLILVLKVLLLDCCQFLIPVIFDLLDRLLVPVDELLVVLLLLIDLSLLVLHLLAMVLLLKEDLVLVVLLDLLNGSQVGLMLTLLQRLQLGELFGVVEHALGVLVALLLDFLLLAVKQFATFDFLRVL